MKAVGLVALGFAWMFLAAAVQLLAISHDLAAVASVNVLLSVVLGVVGWRAARRAGSGRMGMLLIATLLVPLGAHALARFARLEEQREARLIQLAIVTGEIVAEACLDGMEPRVPDLNGMHIVIERANGGGLRGVRGMWRPDGGVPNPNRTMEWSVWRSAELVPPSMLERAILRAVMSGTTVSSSQSVSCFGVKSVEREEQAKEG
jgi:hypothetical protein